MKRLAIVAVVALLGGCTSSPSPQPAPASAPAWTEPADYSFVVDRQCGQGESLGRYRVQVAGRAVSQVDRIDGKTAAGEEEIEVPTLAGLLELAQTAIDDGADATTAFDPADGHPVEVNVNRAEESSGGADCFKISEYTPA